MLFFCIVTDRQKPYKPSGLLLDLSGVRTLNAFADMFELAAECYLAHGSQAASIAATSLMAARSGSLQADGALVPPIEQHLPNALAASAHALAKELVTLQDRLQWRPCEFGPIPPYVGARMAFCQIVGPGAPVDAPDFRAGLFLQQPDLFYPWHSHEAEELYLVISGNALWRTPGLPFEQRSPGDVVYHPSWVSHAMQTTDEPLLAMWVWVGNINATTYRMDDLPND